MPDAIEAAARSTFAPEAALRALEEIRGSDSQAALELERSAPEFLRVLGEVLLVSPPMLDAVRVHPDWIGWLRRRSESGAAPDALADWDEWTRAQEPGLARLDVLRAFKRRQYLETVFRDIGGMAPFEETVGRLSSLADFVIGEALRYSWFSMAGEGPETLRGAETPEGVAVFALGKLGGRELNYSSDVDLIFCRRNSDSDTHLRFYTRLGERLVQSLSGSGRDGFLYRVDMRLRPHGETGALVPTVNSLVNYYESWGEAWERQALIKARFVAGCPELGERFTRFVSQFTFSRQMDDSSLEEIKRVKHRAEKEHAPSPGKVNLKQGPGGIRDIEFYVQYLQLIAGSAHPEVRTATTLEAIRGLAQARALLEHEEAHLSLAYVFLRTVEHRLQLRSLTPQVFLPADRQEMEALSRGLGFEEPAKLLSVLQDHRSRVRAILERIYLTPGYLRLNEREEEFARLLSERTPRERARSLLANYGFQDVDRAWQNLRLLALGPAGRLLPPGERRAFLEFVFPLLEVLRDSIDPDQALHNLESFASSTGNRISFLRTLASRRPHLMRLTNLLAVSNRCQQILIRHPEYFDSLARGIFLQQGRRWAGMLTEIRERTGMSPQGEAHDLLLRRYRQREMVRIAYRDLAGLDDAPEISRELSELAEACVLAAAGLARPRRTAGYSPPEPERFRVVGLGKLGSAQMHYGSDLDLLFVYEPAAGESSPELRAADQLEQDRRAERMLELLASVTAEGVAYAVDLRLRPEGASGLLARSWSSFVDYAREFMKPWERMALVRSRVLGLEERDRWEAVLAEAVYGFDWNEEALESIRHLKRRIETELNKESRTFLDFKFGKGGIADLEFLVKALQVRYGGSNRCVRAPAVDAALPALQEAGALTAGEAEQLLAAHRFQRRVENRYQLQEEWNSREISRESPKLTRLARSLGHPGRKEFLEAWAEVAASVRRLVDKYFYESV